jgi:polyhydroxyalkanoate synthesis regulator phasin
MGTKPGKGDPMMEKTKETLTHAALLALGAAYTTAKGVKSLLDDMVKRGQLSTTDARKVGAELVERGKQARTEINAAVAKTVAEHLKTAGLATKDDIEKLEERLGRLETRGRAK